jgi:hypothetical protein
MNKDLDEYIQSIRKAMDRETAISKSNDSNDKNKPSPSDVLIAAREMMRRVKDDRSNKTNR